MRFNILQYLPKNTKIRLDKKLMGNLFSGKSVTEWGKLLNIPIKNMSRYINGTRSFSIELLNQLIFIKKMNMVELQDKMETKISKSGKYIKIGPFIKPDEKWVYVSELIKGDGHITPNFWTITFVNKENALIKYVEKFFKDLGIKKTQISLTKRKNVNFLTIRSSVLAHIFNKILDNPAGKKRELKISNFILSNKKLSISAVRGAFDAEGSVTFTGSRRISITSNSKNWLNQIKKILETLRIESRITEDKSKRETPIYRILIFHKSNLKKFLKIIAPLHPKRKERLNEILGNYTKNSQKEFHKKILISIQKGNTRKMEIASNTKQTLILTGNNLNWLKKKKYIIPYEKICTNKGSFHRYKLTPKGEEYLNKSLSFFD